MGDRRYYRLPTPTAMRSPVRDHQARSFWRDLFDECVEINGKDATHYDRHSDSASTLGRFFISLPRDAYPCLRATRT
eukprot:8390054-Pyramimonas_sp.AAC.1